MRVCARVRCESADNRLVVESVVKLTRACRVIATVSNMSRLELGMQSYGLRHKFSDRIGAKIGAPIS